MLRYQKWLLTGWLIILTLGIIGMSIYNLKRSTLLENGLRKEIEEVKKAMSKLKEDVEQIKKEILKPEKTLEIGTSDWKKYRNEKFKFEITFPKDSEIKQEGESRIFVTLPDRTVPLFTPESPGKPVATPTISKYFEISIIENLSSKLCSIEGLSEMGLGFLRNPKIVQLGNIEFEKATGWQEAAGPDYEVIGYTTFKGNNCFLLKCTLRYDVFLDVYGIPTSHPNYEQFDKQWSQAIDEERNLCDRIVSTFQFIE
jgi:hypothetical protein